MKLYGNVVIASETGALGPGSSSPEIRANKPPVVKIDFDGIGQRMLTLTLRGHPDKLIVSRMYMHRFKAM